MKIAYVLYPRFTALDLIGPYEVISRWPGAEVHFVASSLEPVRADRGLTVIPTDTPDTMPQPDLIVVPGSEDPLHALEDRRLIDWLAAAAPGCRWTASVCTGAGLYAAAGLLDGKTATTHWGFRDNLRALGVTVVGDRVVWDGTHISGAGVWRCRSPSASMAARSRRRCSWPSNTTPSRRSTAARPTKPMPAPSGSRSACCSATGRCAWRPS